MCSQKECPTKFETRWLQEIPFSKELTDNYCALGLLFESITCNNNNNNFMTDSLRSVKNWKRNKRRPLLPYCCIATFLFDDCKSEIQRLWLHPIPDHLIVLSSRLAGRSCSSRGGRVCAPGTVDVRPESTTRCPGRWKALAGREVKETWTTCSQLFRKETKMEPDLAGCSGLLSVRRASEGPPTVSQPPCPFLAHRWSRWTKDRQSVRPISTNASKGC